jgi:hypothetical protein
MTDAPKPKTQKTQKSILPPYHLLPTTKNKRWTNSIFGFWIAGQQQQTAAYSKTKQQQQQQQQH